MQIIKWNRTTVYSGGPPCKASWNIHEFGWAQPESGPKSIRYSSITDTSKYQVPHPQFHAISCKYTIYHHIILTWAIADRPLQASQKSHAMFFFSAHQNCWAIFQAWEIPISGLTRILSLQWPSFRFRLVYILYENDMRMKYQQFINIIIDYWSIFSLYIRMVYSSQFLRKKYIANSE